MPVRCRDADCVRPVKEPPPNISRSLHREGVARQKAQTFGIRDPWQDHGGRLSARQLRRLFGSGPRFPLLDTALK